MTGLASAGFDVAFISDALGPALDGLRPAEVHSVSYLARLLVELDEAPSISWGYEFASTSTGAPFASRIDEAVTLMIATGNLLEDRGLLISSSRGSEMFEQMRRMNSLQSRERYLEPACSVSLTMPLPAVTDALVHEPQLRVALALGQTRPLLDEVGRSALLPYVEGLRSVTASTKTDDLLVHAVIWVTYLATARANPEAENAA
jgi:hypothetical protein